MAKQTITITLHMSEILYNVQNTAFLTGRSRETGQNQEEVAHIQGSDDEEVINQLLRFIGNAFTALKTPLSEFIVSTQTTGSDILFDVNASLVVTLSMPNNYNNATVETVSTAIHQYIANTAIAEWFTITNKNDAKDYIDKAAANLAQIRDAINKRVRPTRTNPTGSGSGSGH